MTDPFSTKTPDLGSFVYSRSFPITPGMPFATPTRALWIGAGSGALSITTNDDGAAQVYVFGSGWTGGLVPIRASAVSGTWAGGAIVGLL
jgi:hypothetical protein